MTNERTVDPAYLAYQYADSEKLRIRAETHERYSEQTGDWLAPILERLRPWPGSFLLDVGCGFGSVHQRFCAAGAHIVGFDLSLGMVREAHRQAVREPLPAQVFQADAQSIPLQDAVFDLALASHVLFHVPDVMRVLQEMRRVLKPGGRMLATTNASDHSARLYDLHCQAARDLGFTPSGGPGNLRFTLDDLPLVRSVFPTAKRVVLPNAFLFPTADSALRFYATGRIDSIAERQSDGSHRPPLLERMDQLIEEIIEREGVFRVPKDNGFFVATVEV
jgi:ubiquinone/menaquinone biosynthesis C-methylase UbiE